MSRGTTLKLLRIFPGRKISKAAFAKLLEKEKSSWGDLFSRKDEKFVAPKLISCPAKKDPRETAVVRDTREVADVLLSWDFTSSFTSLTEAYSLSCSDPGRTVAFVSDSDAYAMRLACGYLLSEKYSREMDAVFSEASMDWLSVLAKPYNGEVFWKWVYWDKPELLQSAMEDDDGTAKYYVRRLQLVLDVLQSTQLDFSENGEKLVLAVQAWG